MDILTSVGLPIAEPAAADEALEDDRDNDNDSAIGISLGSDTTSLNSSIIAYRVENGRRYHGEFWVPNDEQQCEQMDIGHHLHTLVLDGKLFLAPLDEAPQKVLDLGTGTGIWAMDFADQFPSAVVIGTDISPIQPDWIPPNIRFEIEDFDDEWTFHPNDFDYIHLRCLYGCVTDWPRFYKQAYDCLKPGAWLEHYEISIQFRSDDGSVKLDSAMEEFNRTGIESGLRSGKSNTVCEDMTKHIGDAGFVNIVNKEFKAPHGAWAADLKWKEIGIVGLVEFEIGLEGFCMAVLTRLYGWSYTNVQEFCGRLREELRSSHIHSYHYTRLVYGQKPKQVLQNDLVHGI